MPRKPTGNRPGRPISDDPRRHVIAVRLTDAEHAEALALAEASGKAISDALRTHGLKGWRAALKRTTKPS